MTRLPTIERFDSSNGARIYRIPLEAFPEFIVYCYVVLDAGPPTLIDVGSGFGNCNEQLLSGLEALHDQFGEPFLPMHIERILITHGHIDHFGGIGFAREHTQAKIGIHPLDRRVLTAYEERVVIASKELRIFLERAGVDEALRQELLDMYTFAKQHVNSVPVDIKLEEYKPLDGMEFIHTPGHCSGQVCIKIGDILISADHILARITPHQAPESITHYTGLGHYLDSLYKIARVEGVRVALGGHEAPVYNFYERIIEIRASHQRKLNHILDLIDRSGAPCTIEQISAAMYPDKQGYDILLALEEVGAHIEYLYQHGQLAISNLEQVEQEVNPPLYYGIA
ncbi:MAG: MBL fold metallo-hydrolase [Anaerolineae bacterium]|nr:MBL fold metallo-hydrolase [Anaerolineae bacterium]